MMNHPIAFILTLVALLAPVNASIASPGRRRTSLSHKNIGDKKILDSPVLKIRGGAGPVDPIVMAKTATVVSLAQGVVMNVAPGPSLDMYGMSDYSPLTKYLMRLFGTGILSFSIVAYCMLFHDMSLVNANCLGSIPWVFEHLRSILCDLDKEAGIERKGAAMALALTTAQMFVCKQDYASEALKYFAGFWMANGLYLVLSPTKAASSVWGFPEADFDTATNGLTRGIGFFLTSISTLLLSVVFKDTEMVKAIGQGYISWFLLMFTDIFITKVPQELGIPMASQYFWLVFHAVTAATTLL